MRKPILCKLFAAGVMCIALALSGCSGDDPVMPDNPNNPINPDDNSDNKNPDNPNKQIDEYTYETAQFHSLWLEGKGTDCRWELLNGTEIVKIHPEGNRCFFISPKEGEYKISFTSSETKDKESVYKIKVKKDSTLRSYISEVIDYKPMPGQFINTLPEIGSTRNPKEINKLCNSAIAVPSKDAHMICLGAYGGSVTFKFDHTIINKKGFDFAIFGNAFGYEDNQEKENTLFGSSEPGIVMVAWDKNNNGKPDPDEWYEIAGSRHSDPQTIHNYTITYSRPRDGKRQYPKPEEGMMDERYIRWEDNQDKFGYIPKMNEHQQDYWPLWYTGEEAKKLTFTGTRLPDNSKKEGPLWKMYFFEWGYVDNRPNHDLNANSFDIDWAIDKNGNKVKLPAIDFIKVYTGVNQVCGAIGEVSTEVTGARDLSMPDM